MKINGNSLDFFQSLPDDLLIQIALNDWESLERLCVALTLDIQLLKEELNLVDHEGSSNRREMC